MACNISQGRLEVCKESVGGLAAVYFLPYTSASFSHTGGDAGAPITAFPSGSTVYYYQLKGTSAYTETVNSSRENGTTFFQQELVLNLKKLTNEMTTQLRLLAWGRNQIVISTLNGDALVAGERQGCDLTAGNIQTGGSVGDLYGYSLTFTGLEQYPASFISGSTYGDPFGALSGSGKPTVSAAQQTI